MHGSAALWYLTRGTGVATLLLLTGSVVLGVLHTERRRLAGTPRLVVDTLHRTISLLVVALLVVHILTAVLDTFAPIRLADAIIPFTGVYRPLYLGFGALAFDLLIALTVTSLLRARLGAKTWRSVHWLAYACWPVAVVHGLGTGSDVNATWMLLLTLACIAGVAFVSLRRLVHATEGRTRNLGLGATALAAVALAVWLPQGPLQPGWARRSGTPARLLAPARVVARPVAKPVRHLATAPSFASRLGGRVRRGVSRNGIAVIDLSLRALDNNARVRIRLAGQELPGGGLQLERSAVDLIDGTTYAGRIQQLNGGDMVALVGAADGRATRLRIRLLLNGNDASGSIAAVPVARQSE